MAFSLESLDGAFAPELRQATFLDPGDYGLEVLDAELKRHEAYCVLRMTLRVESPDRLAGSVINWALLVEDEFTAGTTAGQLRDMGVDVASWPSLSEGLPACVPQLRGLRFLGNAKHVVRADGRAVRRFRAVKPLGRAGGG